MLRVVITITILACSMKLSALTLDWNNVTWASGDLTNSYDVDGDTVNDLTITVTPDFSPGGTFTSLSGSGLPAPVNDAPPSTPVFQGGLGATNQNLYLGVNFANRDQSVTVTVNFTQLVTDVSFFIYDVDQQTNSYRDIISSVTATDGSTTYSANFTTGTTNTSSDPLPAAIRTINGELFVYGTSTAANEASTGDLEIDFGSNEINSFTFTYSSTPTFIGDGATPSNPGNQGIGLHDINFTIVPEASSFVSAMILCLLGFYLNGRRNFIPRRSH